MKPQNEDPGVVVELPIVGGRKSARKMVKEPAEVLQVRKEAGILARIDELQRLGIWTGKKISKAPAPTKVKTHWDFVVEEMNWLSGVILQERKTKKVRYV